MSRAYPIGIMPPNTEETIKKEVEIAIEYHNGNEDIFVELCDNVVRSADYEEVMKNATERKAFGYMKLGQLKKVLDTGKLQETIDVIISGDKPKELSAPAGLDAPELSVEEMKRALENAMNNKNQFGHSKNHNKAWFDRKKKKSRNKQAKQSRKKNR
ncbi:MAG TPA: hypothetical protein PKU82_07010 [Bacteroidia bacterium]|nr:hypothetical protein [Bacteroidia bacterium]HOZ90846.1 hypothetical protein [Bacteroidia bacterium]HRB52052.1 hypothetical protein [Bacteroidia bacterium]